MENTQIQDADLSDKNKNYLTPRELIKRHMEHPENPITDEDMNNLKLSDADESQPTDITDSDGIILTKKEKDVADNFADELNDANTGTSYKADL